MKALVAYMSGMGRVLSAGKLWLYLYLALLLFGFLIIMPLYNQLTDSLGHSLALGENLGSFDYTLVADFFNNYGLTFATALYQAKWLILLYLVFTVFTTAGMVAYFFARQEKLRLIDFLKEATYFFWRFLRLSIYFILLQVVLFVMFAFFYQKFIGSFSPFEIQNDANLVKGFKWLFPFYCFFALLLFMVQDVAKFEIVRQGKRYIYTPILSAIKKVFKNFWSLLFYYILHLAVFAFFYQLFHWIESAIGVNDGGLLWLVLIIGQLFIALRLGLRMLKFAGLDELRRRTGW